MIYIVEIKPHTTSRVLKSFSI